PLPRFAGEDPQSPLCPPARKVPRPDPPPRSGGGGPPEGWWRGRGHALRSELQYNLGKVLGVEFQSRCAVLADEDDQPAFVGAAAWLGVGRVVGQVAVFEAEEVAAFEGGGNGEVVAGAVAVGVAQGALDL